MFPNERLVAVGIISVIIESVVISPHPPCQCIVKLNASKVFQTLLICKLMEQYFSTLSHKQHNLKKKLLNTICVLISPTRIE